MAADKGATKQPEPASFAQFVWNSETKQFLGRSGISWLKITVFYIIFYICLAAFWALMLVLHKQTLDVNAPKWQLDASRIGSNPGLGYRPRPPDSNIDSTLIKFRSGDEDSYKHWVDNLNEFITRYEKGSNDTVGSGEHHASSSSCDAGQQPPADKFCLFDVKKLANSECTKSQEFGYKTGKPCVLIKINKIFGWKPEPLTELPKEVTGTGITAPPAGVVIECHGENSADVEKLGKISYHPSSVIPSTHFPFTNQPGYLPPFVMVQFESPSRGALINIECRAWAKNIKYDRQDRTGCVHFELMLE